MTDNPQASKQTPRLATALVALALIGTVAVAFAPMAQAAEFVSPGGGSGGSYSGGPGGGVYYCRSVGQEVNSIGVSGLYFFFQNDLADGAYCTVQMETQAIAFGVETGAPGHPCNAPADGLGACLWSSVWLDKAASNAPYHYGSCFTPGVVHNCMIGGGQSYTEVGSTYVTYTTNTVATVGGLYSAAQCATSPDTYNTHNHCWARSSPGEWQEADTMCGTQTSTVSGLLPPPSQTTSHCGSDWYRGW